MNNDFLLYKVIRIILIPFIRLVFRPKVIGVENVLKKGGLVLAGNHISNFDALLLICVVKREIHFLAKKEIFEGKIGFLFNRLGLIKVDRGKKNPEALIEACNYLENNKVIGIFPEGTTEKGRGLLDFKIGAVKMAYDTKSMICPFVINGKYKIFKNKLEIKFLKPYLVKENLELENDKLRNLILKERKDN